MDSGSPGNARARGSEALCRDQIPGLLTPNQLTSTTRRSSVTRHCALCFRTADGTMTT